MSKRTIIIAVVAVVLFVAALLSCVMDFKKSDLAQVEDQESDQKSEPEPEPEPEPEKDIELLPDIISDPEPVKKKPGK